MDQKSWQLVAVKPWQTNNVGKKHAVPAGSPRPTKTPGLKSTKLKTSLDPMSVHTTCTLTQRRPNIRHKGKIGSPRTCRLQRGPKEGRGQRMRTLSTDLNTWIT